MTEQPKRYTALNDVTGDLIKSRADGQDKYAVGWDRIFGKPKAEEKDEECLYCGQDPCDLDCFMLPANRAKE